MPPQGVERYKSLYLIAGGRRGGTGDNLCRSWRDGRTVLQKKSEDPVTPKLAVPIPTWELLAGIRFQPRSWKINVFVIYLAAALCVVLGPVSRWSLIRRLTEVERSGGPALGVLGTQRGNAEYRKTHESQALPEHRRTNHQHVCCCPSLRLKGQRRSNCSSPGKLKV